MRQPALGRLEWIQEAHKKTEDKGGKKATPAPKKAAAKPAPKPAAKEAPASG
jgi:hypothetical protein